MATRANRVVVRELRTLFNLGVIGELTDGQLLERFATHGTEAAEFAFAAIVERHGPMVLRVCRSALRDRHLADDAFQATFLVLAQKARSLWVNDSLGPWLHRVAHRIATKARHSEARRREHERRAAALSPRYAREPDNWNEQAALLHEEIDRLSERFRTPIVLCDMQGLTHEKAARHLGWPVGTVKSRLARAREILRGRLSRRGLDLHAGLLIAAKGPATAVPAVSCVMPASLAESTVSGATALASGKATAGAISAGVIYLIEQGLKTMYWNKLKIASIALFFSGAVAATTAGVLAQSGNRSKSKPVDQFDRPAADSLRGGRISDSAPATETVPFQLTQSRAAIVSMIEETRNDARARRDRALNTIGGHTDPAAIEAQKTVDALDHIVARIDEVLVDAVKAFPRMFDISEEPAPASTQNQSVDRSPPRPVDATTDPFAEQSKSAQLSRARDRLRWADELFRQGYLSKSVVDLERLNVSRLDARLKDSPRESVLSDRQQQPRRADLLERVSESERQGAASGAKPGTSQMQDQPGSKSGNSQRQNPAAQNKADDSQQGEAATKNGVQKPQNQAQSWDERNRSQQAPQGNNPAGGQSQNRSPRDAGQPSQSGDRKSGEAQPQQLKNGDQPNS